jgi:cobalt/nickel transport system permease protein
MLFLVHISDGILEPIWLVIGFLVAILILFRSAKNIEEEEIPRIGLLTAAFFVASLIHIRVGPTSVHLILNGLLGILLGWRAGLAIFCGLFLQALLLGHGGFTTLGLNCCVITLPALFSRFLYQKWSNSSFSTDGFIFIGLISWGYILHPLTILWITAFFFLWNRMTLFFRFNSDFCIGFLTGMTSVLLTSILNSFALVIGGVEDWKIVALWNLVVHLPIALVEGLIVGFVISFLSNAKPEMLPVRKGVVLPTSGEQHRTHFIFRQ